MLHYLKFMSFHVMALAIALMVSLGGSYISIAFVGLVGFFLLADGLLGDDTSEPTYKFPQFLTVQLWMALPLMFLVSFICVWQFASVDVFSYGATFQSLTGIDILAARADTHPIHYVSLSILLALSIGLISTLVGHELTHRTWDPVSMFIGRWLLAFSFDSNFSIEHVYGHHRYVSTKDDPATAPRGRNVYAHLFISTYRGNISAWVIEAERLKKKGQGLFSVHNLAIRGYLMSIALVVGAYYVAGWQGAVFFTISAILGKFVLEIVNFMEHYGMVRNPEVPVQPYHSWNTNKLASSWLAFNLTRHSHHHAQGEVPYQDLKPYADAPMMVGGYLTTVVVALIPPLWNKLMIPKVLAWDQKYASDEELQLANAANKISGIAAFEAVNYKVKTMQQKAA